MFEFLLSFKFNSQTSTLFIKLIEIKTCPIGDKPSPDFEPTFPVIEIDISDPNKSFTALDISFAISGLTTPYSWILFLSIFNILIFEGVEYVTTPPKKIQKHHRMILYLRQSCHLYNFRLQKLSNLPFLIFLILLIYLPIFPTLLLN